MTTEITKQISKIAAHTPTPSPVSWDYGITLGREYFAVFDDSGTTVASLLTEANAEFIVRACNSYQAMKEALEALLPIAEERFQRLSEQAFVRGEILLPWDSITKAQAALKLAEGK
jgi:hypothetical protein